MPRPNRPGVRGPLYAVPGPLYGMSQRPGTPAPPAAAPVLPSPAPLPLRPAEVGEVRMRRHKNPIPAPSQPELEEIRGLLCRENQLLVELLSAVQSLTAAVLLRRERRED